jgi:hypothetical protein
VKLVFWVVLTHKIAALGINNNQMEYGGWGIFTSNSRYIITVLAAVTLIDNIKAT